ncbi:MAG TPA: glycosyltransferase family 39 protein [Anaerolineales bacterium]
MNREGAKNAKEALRNILNSYGWLSALGERAASLDLQRAIRGIAAELMQVSLHGKLLAALVVLGAGLRLYLLADKSIWLDEAFSIIISQRDLAGVLEMIVRTDTHPPLYYLLLKMWLSLGEGEAWVRLLSTLFSLAAIPAMYNLAGELYENKWVGLIGATILTFSPFQVWYAQEARMYAMLTTFVLASAYFLIRGLRHGARRDWVGYVLTTALALYTDNGAIWYVATITIFYMLSFKRFRGRFRQWILSQIAVGLLYLPWLPFFWRQTRLVTEDFWLPAPDFHTVLATFLDFHSLNFPLIELSLIYMAMIFVWAYIIPRETWQRRLASLWWIVPLIISLLLSLRQPIFLSRNLIVASLGYYLLIAGTIWQFKTRKAILALLLPLIAMNLVSIGYNARVEEKEDWRSVAGYVAQEIEDRPGGLVVFNPGYTELPFSYYFERHDVPIRAQGYPGDEVLLHPQPRQVEDIGALMEGVPYVWLVERDIESDDPDQTVKEWLDNNGYVRQEDFLRKDLRVLTYYRWDKAPASGAPGRSINKPQAYFPLIHRAVEMETYTVRPGETLLEIALRFDTTVQFLMDANRLQDPNSISDGKELYVPKLETVDPGNADSGP